MKTSPNPHRRRNPQDMTGRNNNARKGEIARLSARLARNERRSVRLEERVVALEIVAGIRDLRGRRR